MGGGMLSFATNFLVEIYLTSFTGCDKFRMLFTPRAGKLFCLNYGGMNPLTFTTFP